LKRGAAAKADQMFVDELLFAGGQPGHVESKRGKPAIEIPKFRPGEYAQHQWRQRLDRMLHLLHQRALQADHVRGKRIVEDLPASVVEHLVAEGPAAEHSIKLLAARSFTQEARARLDTKLVDLEFLYEGQFFAAEFTQAGAWPKRTLFARSDLPV